MSNWFRWHRRAWNDRRFLQLDHEEFRLLMTLKAILPRSGIGVLGDRQIRAKSQVEGWSDALRRLSRKGWIKREEAWTGERVYWLIKGLENESLSARDAKGVTGVRRQVRDEVPDCHILQEFLRAYPIARQAPSHAPSQAPSDGPSQAPSQAPSRDHREAPSQGPSQAPTDGGSRARREKEREREKEKEKENLQPQRRIRGDDAPAREDRREGGDSVLLSLWKEVHEGKPPPEIKARKPDAYRTTVLGKLWPPPGAPKLRIAQVRAGMEAFRTRRGVWAEMANGAGVSEFVNGFEGWVDEGKREAYRERQGVG